jgi:hypothetical protein
MDCPAAIGEDMDDHNRSTRELVRQVIRDDHRGTTTVTDYAPDPSTETPHGDVVLSLVQSCGVVGADASRVRDEFAERYERAASKQENIEVLLSVVGRCVDERHPFAYLSVPLTTGRAYMELRARYAAMGNECDEEFQAERERTIAENRGRAHEAAERLRANLPGMIIDPSRFTDVQGWEQKDYHAFWAKVIGQYAEEVFFLDGWQYSVGCTIEFSEAVKLGLPTLTTELAALNAATGRQLVHAAVNEYIEVGLDHEPLRDALSITEKDFDESCSRLSGE